MTSTSSISKVNPILPNDVIRKLIFSNLSLPALGACSRVCKAWKEMTNKHINAFSHPHAFGPKEWNTYFGAYLRNVPRLPYNIKEVLNSPCPFWPYKKVSESHLLVLVPQTVQGQPLTLKTLGKLVKKPSQGNASGYDFFYVGHYTDSDAPPSHWVLLTRDVIEGSRNKSFKDQQALLEKQVVYEIPPILDATVCIFIEYIRAGTKLYSTSPWTFTRCKEKYDAIWQLAVGGFGPDGLNVTSSSGDDEDEGVGGCRKFEAIGH
jgi:hypothetical protein